MSNAPGNTFTAHPRAAWHTQPGWTTSKANNSSAKRFPHLCSTLTWQTDANPSCAPRKSEARDFRVPRAVSLGSPGTSSDGGLTEGRRAGEITRDEGVEVPKSWMRPLFRLSLTPKHTLNHEMQNTTRVSCAGVVLLVVVCGVMATVPESNCGRSRMDQNSIFNCSLVAEWCCWCGAWCGLGVVLCCACGSVAIVTWCVILWVLRLWWESGLVGQWRDGVV